jgi:hypothetical protein
MKSSKTIIKMTATTIMLLSLIVKVDAQEAIKYNSYGLTTDLGVGLWGWPLPMDWDGDGDFDLIVSCPDKPYNGTYFFENTGNDSKRPIFKKAVKVGDGFQNIQVSYFNDKPLVLMGQTDKPALEFVDFIGKGFKERKELTAMPEKVGDGNVRAKQWKYVDFDGDNVLDLTYGVGFWGEYGWDNAYNSIGEWKNGPLRGYVYVYKNKGSNDKPQYEKPYRLQADGKDLDVYGMPSPNLGDFDNDGDLDIICGEFLDGFTYFKNVGTRQKPVYEKGMYLTNKGKKITLHIEMITPIIIDWDKDGDLDIISGDEDGRIAFIENTGKFSKGIPQFNMPVYFQQEADELKFGALSTPFAVDWDNDGDEDIIAGNSSGNISFIENLRGGSNPTWAKPVLLEAGGKEIHIQAGKNGSIQGPAEMKWGYTVLNVADWDHDGLLDLVVNSIYGQIIWYKNTGTKTKPKLAKACTLEVEWTGSTPKPKWNWWNPKGKELVTQWRTTPCIVDWNKDGLNDLIMLDTEGYLAFYERTKVGNKLKLLPGKRIFKGTELESRYSKAENNDSLLRLNNREAGGSGRRKLVFVDWDNDGDLDLIVNSLNATLLENVGTKDGFTQFVDKGVLGERKLAGHSTCPTAVDWDKDGISDLLVGAEDGRFYFIKNPNPN